MTQEDKELLLKDLCARLPYGIKISPKEKDTGEYDRSSCRNYIYPDVIEVDAFIPDGDNTRIEYGEWIVYLDNIQLYLFPMSSMTVRQGEEFAATLKYLPVEGIDIWTLDTYDWCNKNNFDYRGLIPKGLARDATGLNIY